MQQGSCKDPPNDNACAPQAFLRKDSASPEIGAMASDDKSPLDVFYDRLRKINEVSGLSVVFDLRQTSLDLYLFYKDVTERGGFHQVEKSGRWGEVASAVNLKACVTLSPTQLRMLYMNLLYQFEQTYYYRTPVEIAKTADATSPSHSLSSEDDSSCPTRKRKMINCTSPLSILDSGNADSPASKQKCLNNYCKSQIVSTTTEQEPIEQISLEIKKEVATPKRWKTAYHTFLKMECHRLKAINSDKPKQQNWRDIATKAWKCLSETDRQPYIEASMKDKYRYTQEMGAYLEQIKMQNSKSLNMPSSSTPCIINFAAPLLPANDYHVALQPDDQGVSVPNKTTVNSASKMMGTAQTSDPIFQIIQDECYST